jgi:hypothetical protein
MPLPCREVTGLLTSTSFDRKQEEEMDNELIQHFEIISTHPNFHSRIREALSFKPAKDFEAESIDMDWELIRAEL